MPMQQSVFGIALATVFAATAVVVNAETRQDHPAAEPATSHLGRIAEVSVSSEQNGFSKNHAIDGKAATEWASNGPHPWIMLQWKEPVKVGRIVLRD